MRPLFALLAFLLGLWPGLVHAQTGVATFVVGVLGETDPPAGLAVTIYADDPATAPVSAIVGETGLVVLPGVLPGSYRAFPADGMDVLPIFEIPARVWPDSAYAGVVILERVDPAQGLIRGQISRPDGTPARFQFATVASTSAGDGVASTRFIADGLGRFAFQLPPGERTLTVNAFDLYDTQGPVYEPVSATVTVAAGQPATLDLPLTLRPFGQLEGTVRVAATGAPRAGVTVFAQATDNSFAAETVSGPDGRYAFDLPAGNYVLDVPGDGDLLSQYYDRAPTAATATPVTVAGNATTSGIDFSLETLAPDFSATFAGTVVGTDGTPLAGARVAVYEWADAFFIPNATPLLETTTGEDGTFTMTTSDPAVYARQVVVYTSADGFEAEFWDDRPSALVATLLAAPNATTTFALGAIELRAEGEEPPGLVISGTIRDRATQAGVAGATVAAARLDAPGTFYAAADDDGQYRLAGLPAGRYVVLFSAAAYTPAFFPDAAAWTAAEALDLAGDLNGVDGLIGGLNRPVGALRDGGDGRALTGVVRDDAGAPLAGALVVARGDDGQAVDFAFSDATGGYRLTGLPEGFVTVQTDLPRFDVAQAALTIGAGVGRLDVALPAATTVAAGDAPDGPADDLLLSIAPNPARGALAVRLVLPAAADARVTLSDVLGREVLVLYDGPLAEGPHALRADASRLASGVYVLRVQTPEGATSRRLTVLR